MAARKLQSEIDRTLKKVTEGVELFESIYDKMQASTNQTQKEKLETDLKTQIKKLQRLRDQIKTWVASNDIKDKSQLMENRKLIETQMEKFKACEKEMKTKAFSKEGLIQASKLDPKAQEKLAITQWLHSRVEELSLQVEAAEAEVESLQGGVKKKHKGSATSERLEDLERLNERRKWHISRLEIVLRLLDNGSLPIEKVTALKDDVSYFVESNTEEDFDEDEGIYDELNLDDFGLVMDEDESDDESEADSEDVPPRTPSKKMDEESVTSSKRDDYSPILKKATIAPQVRKSSTTEAAKPPPPLNPNFVSQPMSSVVKSGLPPAPRPPAALPVRYAAAAAAAVNPTPTVNNQPAISTAPLIQSSTTSSQPVVSSTTVPAAPLISPQPLKPVAQDQISRASSSPSLTHPSVSAPSPILSSAASISIQHNEDSFHSSNQSPALSEAVPLHVDAPVVTSSPVRLGAQNATSSPSHNSPIVLSTHVQGLELSFNSTQLNGGSQPHGQPAILSSPLPQQIQQPPPAPVGQIPDSLAIQTNSQQPAFPPGVKVPQTVDHVAYPSTSLQDQTLRHTSPAPSLQQQQYQPQVQQRAPSTASVANAFPGSLQDLVTSFENVKQKAPHRMANLEQVHKMLEGGFTTMPEPQDTEKPKYYVPRNPYQTPSYYPQTLSQVLSSPGLFSQLDIETLFYVFYYLPGTYQQYLAARELKRQSWRFHVKYLTWFQRHSEPQAITEEYEQGVYVYFDWEGSWCQRKKSDFRFEYRYLSED